MLQRNLTILLFLTFSLSQLNAQSFDEKDFTVYTTKDGLSNNQAWSVVQDSYGYIWVATRKGLNRFDGNSFRQFFADTSRNSLPQDWVYKLKMLDKEQLAAITLSGGLHIINTRTLKGHSLTIKPDSSKSLYPLKSVRDVLKDKEGNIFILSTSGFYQFNAKDQLVFRYDHYSQKESRENFGYTIIMVNDNIILLSSESGMYVYKIAQKDLHAVGNSDEMFYQQIITPRKNFWFTHGDNNSISLQVPGENNFFWGDLVRKVMKPISVPADFIKYFDWASELIRLNDTLFAINAQVGFYLIHYDKVSDSFTFSPTRHFENYFCNKLFVDRNNRLLIATNKGLFRQKGVTAGIEQTVILSQGSSFKESAYILTMAIANNKIFAGTFDEGLLIFDNDSLKISGKIDFSKLRTQKSLKIVNNIEPISNDTIVIGPPGIWVNSHNLTIGKMALPDWTTGEVITSMFKDSRNNFYLSKRKDNMLYFRGSDKKFKIIDYTNSSFSNIQYPSNITEDPNGNIWYSSHGITRFNYQLQKFDLLLDSFPFFKIASKLVSSNLVFDKEGNIYFGVEENGLIVYNLSNKKFTQHTRANGLPDNNILALYFHNNKVWIGTEGGLANYDLSSKKIFSFGVADGMPADAFSSNNFCYDSARQQLYAAFNNTIVRFNPDQLTKNNSPPLFFIENIAVGKDNTLYHPGDKIELSYKQNSIIVNVAAINFEDASQQQFAYRFATNSDEPWQEIGSQRSIIFSNLSPGKHKLQLKVFIKNNSWPEQVKEIIITIHPPFWKTAWFLLLLGLIVLTIISSFYRNRIKNIRQKANIDKQLAELEMKGLHAQMNPHFIFNSLNSIKEMILEDEKQNASRYLSKFAQLIRTNLEQSRQTFITVKQSIVHLDQYLEMEKIRFDKFNYSIEVEPRLPVDEIRMAPMLIQPLAENAIWHGLQNKDGDKNLIIRFFESNHQLVCEIEDNGIGILQSKKNKPGLRPAHRSLGIANIHERLVVLNEKYKMNCSLTITDKSELTGEKNSGTIAILRLNL